MKLRLIDCLGGGRDNPHSYSVQGEQTPRCSACHDCAYKVFNEDTGQMEERNVWDKLVDRKPVYSGPQKPYAHSDLNLGRTVYSGFGVT